MHPVLSTDINQFHLLNNWFEQMDYLITQTDYKYRFDIMSCQLCSLFMAISDEISSLITSAHPDAIRNRGWFLAGRFMGLVSIFYTEHHDVAFYASHLAISVEYLCRICLIYYESRPKEIIDGYLITAIKNALTTTELSVKSIAVNLNFPDASYMSRYFKRIVGVSPLEYKRNAT